MLSDRSIIDKISSNPGNTICVTHRRDFDGLASAAFVIHYNKIPLNNIMFSDHNKADMSRALRAMKNMHLKNGVAIFADLPLNVGIENTVKSIIKTLQDSRNTVIWLDHHRLSSSGEKLIKKCDIAVYGENKRKCAAELVYAHLVTDKSDRYGKELARMAHVSDFYLGDKRYLETLINFGHAITYINYNDNTMERNLRRLVGCISNNDYKNRFVMINDNRYKKEARINKDKLRKNVETHMIGSIRIGIGSGMHIMDNEACRNIIMDEFSCDVAVFINVNGSKLNMRSRDGIDCYQLAKSLGGGGHMQAAGAAIKGVNLKTAAGIKLVRRKILKNATTLYLNKRKRLVVS